MGKIQFDQARKDLFKNLLNTVAANRMKIESSSADCKHGLNYCDRETRIAMHYGLQDVILPRIFRLSCFDVSVGRRDPLLVGSSRRC